MTVETLHKWQRIMLMGLIITLPLTTIPQKIAIPGLGSSLSDYFFIFGLCLIIYEFVKYKFKLDKKIKYFFIIYIVWQIICLLNGLYNYQYNELLTIDQISKLEILLEKLSSWGIVFNELIIIKCWLFIRFTKDIIFLNGEIFLLIFYIYHLYKNNINKAFLDIRRAILCLVIIMGIYSIIELLWLKFSLNIAEDMLIMINPILYDPVSTHSWWPPILWKNQLRSICQEPSFFGIISILALPFLWSYIFEEKRRKWIYLLIGYFSLMIFATNARTAIVIVSGELFLLGVSCLFVYKKEYLKKVLSIFLITIIAFSINMIDFKNLTGYKESSYIDGIENYMESNVGSLTDKNARSNSARLANLVANLNTIKQYPLLGVGNGLESAYLDKNLPDFAYGNHEVMNNWHKYMIEKGVLKSGYPALNKYVNIAVQNGIIGLLIYLSGVLYLLYNLIKLRNLLRKDYKLICLTISMMGLLVAQISSAYFVNCNGIVWGCLYCAIESIKNNDKIG